MPTQKINVLLIDNSARFALRTQLSLFTNGNTGRADIATSLQEARHLLAKNSYNLIVTEILMTDENVLEFIKQIRKNLPGCVLAVLTIHYDETHKLYALEAGAHYFIDKSQAFQELTQLIKELCPG